MKQGIKSCAFLFAASVVLFLALLNSYGSDTTLPKPDPAVERLIDELVEIDAQTVGLHSTALIHAFIADDGPLEFAGGVLGSEKPKAFPQMQNLVRRGAAVIPALIQHLDDRRTTKLVVGGDFFTFTYFGDEYDPKIRVERHDDHGVSDRSENPQYKIPYRRYTVRVGDVCYALIGQIVNRNLLPVRYQPSQGLVINSPVQEPDLISQVKRDWGNIDSQTHMQSLIKDALAREDAYYYDPALQRLKFYYPEEYQRQKTGELGEKIKDFEARRAQKK